MNTRKSNHQPINDENRVAPPDHLDVAMERAVEVAAMMNDAELDKLMTDGRPEIPARNSLQRAMDNVDKKAEDFNTPFDNFKAAHAPPFAGTLVETMEENNVRQLKLFEDAEKFFVSEIERFNVYLVDVRRAMDATRQAQKTLESSIPALVGKVAKVTTKKVKGKKMKVVDIDFSGEAGPDTDPDFNRPDTHEG